MVLFRPVGEKEYELICKRGFKSFPPRLPEQPIFYPVLNQKYAEEIAVKWNKNDKASGYKGYITQFQIDDSYIVKFQVKTVGCSYHQEYWIPSEQLNEFNKHIIGNINIIKIF